MLFANPSAASICGLSVTCEWARSHTCRGPMLRQGTACESASRRRGRGSRSPRSRCRARELSRSSSRTPLQWEVEATKTGRARRPACGLAGKEPACAVQRVEVVGPEKPGGLAASGYSSGRGSQDFYPPARRLAEAQAAIRGASRPPGGDPHCRAALSGAGGTGGRALGEPRFEHSGELPDSATVGVLGERAALSLGRDAAPLFFVREEMPNLVH